MDLVLWLGSIVETEILLQALPTYARRFFSQRSARFVQVHSVLEIFNESKVVDRHDRGDILSMALQSDSLSAEGNFVDDFSKLESGFACRDSGHCLGRSNCYKMYNMYTRHGRPFIKDDTAP